MPPTAESPVGVGYPITVTSGNPMTRSLDELPTYNQEPAAKPAKALTTLPWVFLHHPHLPHAIRKQHWVLAAVTSHPVLAPKLGVTQETSSSSSSVCCDTSLHQPLSNVTRDIGGKKPARNRTALSPGCQLLAVQMNMMHLSDSLLL